MYPDLSSILFLDSMGVEEAREKISVGGGDFSSEFLLLLSSVVNHTDGILVMFLLLLLLLVSGFACIRI